MAEVERLRSLFNIKSGQTKVKSDKDKETLIQDTSSTFKLKESSKSLNALNKPNLPSGESNLNQVKLGHDLSLVDGNFLFEIRNNKYISRKFRVELQNRSLNSTQLDISKAPKPELFKDLRPSLKLDLESKENLSLESKESYLKPSQFGIESGKTGTDRNGDEKFVDSLSYKESSQEARTQIVNHNVVMKKSENPPLSSVLGYKPANLPNPLKPYPSPNDKHDIQLVWSGFILPLVTSFLYFYIRFFHPYIPQVVVVIPVLSLVGYSFRVYSPLDFSDYGFSAFLNGLTSAPQTQLYSTVQDENQIDKLKNKVVEDKNNSTSQEQKPNFEYNPLHSKLSAPPLGSNSIIDPSLKDKSKNESIDTKNLVLQSTGALQKDYLEAANIKVSNSNQTTFKLDNSSNRTYKSASLHPVSSIIKALGDIQNYLYYTPKESIELLELDRDVSKIDIKARIWISRRIVIPLISEILAVDKELVSKGLAHLVCEQPGQNRSQLTPKAPAVSSGSCFSSSGKAASQSSLAASTIFDQTLSKPTASSAAPAFGGGPATNITFSKPTLLGAGSSFSNSNSFGSTVTPLGTGLNSGSTQSDLPYDLVDLYQWLSAYPKESPKYTLALRRLKMERFLSICNSVHSRRALISRIKAFSESTLLREFLGDYGKAQLPLNENIEASTSASKLKLAPGLDFTDTQLLIHLIFTYFDLIQKKFRVDTQLDNFAFSSKRWVPYGCISDHLDGPYIKQLSPGASHLVVVNPNYSIVYDVVRGDSNLFVALMTFASLVKKTAPDEHPLSKIDWEDLLGQH